MPTEPSRLGIWIVSDSLVILYARPRYAASATGASLQLAACSFETLDARHYKSDMNSNTVGLLLKSNSRCFGVQTGWILERTRQHTVSSLHTTNGLHTGQVRPELKAAVLEQTISAIKRDGVSEITLACRGCHHAVHLSTCQLGHRPGEQTPGSYEGLQDRDYEPVHRPDYTTSTATIQPATKSEHI